MEGIKTSRRVIGAGGQAGERTSALSGVLVGQASIRCTRSRRERKTGERYENWEATESWRGSKFDHFCSSIFHGDSFLGDGLAKQLIQFRAEPGTILMRLAKSPPHFRLTQGSS
jgi:hypothetical protein